MMEYRAIPWPWVGLVMALALIGQEFLLTWLGTNPSLVQTSYRMLIMTVGKDYFVALAMNLDGNLGRGRLELKKAIAKFEKEL